MWSLLSKSLWSTRGARTNEALQHTEIETLIDVSTGQNGDVPRGRSYWLQATETNFGLFEQKKNNWKDTWDITEAPESLKNKAQETSRKRQARLQLVAQSQNHRGKDPAAAAGEWRPLQLNSTMPAPDTIPAPHPWSQHVATTAG